MLPILIKTNFLTIYTYGVFVALGFFWFLYVAWKHIRITKYKEEEIFDRTLIAIIIGLFVGRVVYMLFHYDIIVKKGIVALGAIHLYPGMHGLSVFVTFGLVFLLLLTRGKKYNGTEIVAYLTPAICTFLGIVSLGSIFAGTDVGLVTTFPIRLKYAFYDGLRHLPGLYEGVVFLLMAFVFHKLILMIRQGRVEHGLVVSLLFWIVGFVHIGTSQLRDIITYQKVANYRLFDLYFAIFTLLTALIFVMYYVRSHFTGVFRFLSGSFNSHGQGIHPKTERETSHGETEN